MAHEVWWRSLRGNRPGRDNRPGARFDNVASKSLWGLVEGDNGWDHVPDSDHRKGRGTRASERLLGVTTTTLEVQLVPVFGRAVSFGVGV